MIVYLHVCIILVGWRQTHRWRRYTPTELRPFDGTNGAPILLSINRQVFDVTAGKSFYGPGQFLGIARVRLARVDKDGQEDLMRTLLVEMLPEACVVYSHFTLKVLRLITSPFADGEAIL